MSMDKASAEQWVTASAVIVLGIYGYRRLTEATASPVTVKNIVGLANPAPLGAFATAWGFTYLVIAIMAQAAPGLGGGFAILIATSDFLTNGPALFGDVSTQEGSGLKTAGAAAKSGTTTAGSAASGTASTGVGGVTGAGQGAATGIAKAAS